MGTAAAAVCRAGLCGSAPTLPILLQYHRCYTRIATMRIAPALIVLLCIFVLEVHVGSAGKIGQDGSAKKDVVQEDKRSGRMKERQTNGVNIKRVKDKGNKESKRQIKKKEDDENKNN